MGEIIRQIPSVCPVCLKKLPAVLEREEGQGVFLRRRCPVHGDFSVPVWRDRIDLESWISPEKPLSEEEGKNCAGDCRVCAGHTQGTCCVVLEVTKRCNLRCPYCFADGGTGETEPSTQELCDCIDDIVSKARSPLLQLSGGEPTLRDDLPELVAYARAAGCSYIQVNTNGLRMAEDASYVKRLAEAGLDIVFLQFDGTEDAIYRALRNGALMEKKRSAIENCDAYGIGVTLVPTVVRGVNDHALGDIIRFAVGRFPAVRGVHFQPVTYLGRYPARTADGRYTLDELLTDICRQTGIRDNAFLPSRCDHALCEFYATFLVNGRRQIKAMTDRDKDARVRRTSPERNREYVGNHWRRPDASLSERPLPDIGALPLVTDETEEMDFDTLMYRLRNRSFSVTAMAFQDAMNLNLERLYRCSLHVYENGKLLPFCARYLTAISPENV